MVEPILKSPKYTEATKSLKPAEERPIPGGEPSQRLSSFDIIRRTVGEAEDRKTTRDFMNALTTNMKKGVTKLVQIGNTVFIVNFLTKDGKLMPPKTVEFYPLSVEPDNLIDRFRVFPNTLKEMGFVAAISYTDDPEDIPKIEQSGVPVSISQEMVFSDGEMTPMYRIDLRLS